MARPSAKRFRLALGITAELAADQLAKLEDHRIADRVMDFVAVPFAIEEACGMQDTQLLRDVCLSRSERGAIRVDEHLRTSDPAIYAVGDAVEVCDWVTGKPALIALAGPANRMGRIAADNIVGRTSVYRGTLGTAILRVFGLTAACTGANEAALKRANMPYQVIHLHPNSHAGYYPGAKPIALRSCSLQTRASFSAPSAVGEDGVDKRIDVLATALKAGMTVDDLADLELAYAPPYGSAKDPINLAGMAAKMSRPAMST